jgi:hypothetical protein
LWGDESAGVPLLFLVRLVVVDRLPVVWNACGT